MTDPTDPAHEAAEPDSAREARPSPGATRRGALMLGALGASVIVTIRPALAQTAGSVLNCEIPVPDPASGMGAVDADGKMVAANTPGAFPGGRVFRGEDVKAVKRSMGIRALPGTSPDQSQAYMRYIGRLQGGQSGFTCFASLTVQSR